MSLLPNIVSSPDKENKSIIFVFYVFLWVREDSNKTIHDTGILQKSDGKHSKTIHGKGILQKSDGQT